MQVGGFSALMRAFHYSAACNVAVCALLATRVCSCCNPVSLQQQQQQQQQQDQQQQQQQKGGAGMFDAVKPCVHLSIRQMLPLSLFAAITPSDQQQEQQEQQQQQEQREAEARREAFVEWVEAAAAEIAAACPSVAQLIYFRNTAARQLQGCLAYIDRVTSWKRCMNSAFTPQAFR